MLDFQSKDYLFLSTLMYIFDLNYIFWCQGCYPVLKMKKDWELNLASTWAFWMMHVALSIAFLSSNVDVVWEVFVGGFLIGKLWKMYNWNELNKSMGKVS